MCSGRLSSGQVWTLAEPTAPSLIASLSTRVSVSPTADPKLVQLPEPASSSLRPKQPCRWRRLRCLQPRAPLSHLPPLPWSLGSVLCPSGWPVPTVAPEASSSSLPAPSVLTRTQLWLLWWWWWWGGAEERSRKQVEVCFCSAPCLGVTVTRVSRQPGSERVCLSTGERRSELLVAHMAKPVARQRRGRLEDAVLPPTASRPTEGA